jgi:hypothetical protein
VTSNPFVPPVVETIGDHKVYHCGTLTYKNGSACDVRMVAFEWHAWLLFPMSVIAWIYWKLVEKGIRRDMQRSLNNEPLRNGIPHYGVFIFIVSV